MEGTTIDYKKPKRHTFFLNGRDETVMSKDAYLGDKKQKGDQGRNYYKGCTVVIFEREGCDWNEVSRRGYWRDGPLYIYVTK